MSESWLKHLTIDRTLLGLTKYAQQAPAQPEAPKPVGNVDFTKMPTAKNMKAMKPSGGGGSTEGHWRKLKPGQVGKDSSGSPLQGKTWVRKGRLKKWFKPFPHQKSFIDQVTKLPPSKGMIAAHGTGTGKTISSIAAVETLKDKGKAKRALVVAPAGLRANFLKKGVQKFTDSKGVIISNASKDVGEDVEYVITSYSAFRQNPDSFIEKYKPDILIADEAHRAVNTDSSTYKAMHHARQKIPYVMLLTASSVQNKPSDIAPLLSIAEKGKAMHPLGNRKTIQKFVKKRTSEQRGIFGGETKDRKLVGQERLERMIGPNIHYLEDLDAKEKPTKEVEKVEVTMTPEQHKLYKGALKGIDPTIQAKIAAGEPVPSKEAKGLFVRLIYARKVSNSLYKHIPNMTLSEAAEKTPKIRKVLDDAQEHIKKTKDAQIIMYTNFVHGGVDVLEAGLKKRGIKFGVFAGKSRKGMTEESRQQAVEDFLSGKNKVIVITGAGAEGLSLGNTTMVQMVDGHYNPERMKQAEARGIRAKGLSHRDPKDRKVKVKQYVTKQPRGLWRTLTFQKAPKSIDEYVYLTAERKAKINDEMRRVMESNTKIRDAVKKRKSELTQLFGAD